VGGVRWKNVSATEDYIARMAGNQSPAGETRQMTHEERLGDALFTALRLSEGADISVINQRYGVDAWARFGQDLERFVELGLLEVTGSRWRLTRPGILLAHEVMAVFV
jgi:oxygen-independent coproporphyrinogen-3 oxidase